MKKFFNYLKSNFIWILLFVFFAVFSTFFCFILLDSGFTLIDGSLSFSFSLLPFLSYIPLFVVFCFSFLLYYLFAFLTLYIYYYKLYFGKNNWFKFSLVLDKLHKVEEKKLYKKYLKGDISIHDIENIYNIKEDFFNEKFK